MTSAEYVQFMDLQIGDTFMYGKNCYMKVLPITDKDGFTFTAVRLDDGAVETIKAATQVYPFDADLIIK
jgi:hypothetical protein